MTIPPIKKAAGRPAIELIGGTAQGDIAPGGGSGSGLMVMGAEWGNGLSSATVVDGEYGQLARIPWALSVERWEVFAYDASNAPLVISCVIAVEATDFVTNSFASITGSESPSLSSESEHESVILAGWTLDFLADTMFRFTLASHTGSPAKIVLGIRGFV